MTRPVRIPMMPSLLGLLLVAGAAVAAPAPGDPDLAGTCVRCHEQQTRTLAATGGHAAGLPCTSCHPQRDRKRVGKRHRDTLACSTHHDELLHPTHPLRLPRQKKTTDACLVCHAPHGSTNDALLRTSIAARGRLRPIHFSGAFTDPARPGRGVCEVCHTGTDVYRADGRGAAHFTGDCTQCHAHTANFGVVVSDANCVLCHADPAARLAKPSLHHDRFGACSDCHTEVSAAPGPGHRAIPTCTSCHDQQAHPGPAVGPTECTQCHDAHGSDNIRLVHEQITTPDGTAKPVVLANLSGRTDGGQASATAPGTGVCEVCHTTTRFYRADGGGEPHPTTDCRACHDHTGGFAPLVSDATCAICHATEASRFALDSLHRTTFAACSDCHAENSPVPGAGHRAVQACTDCHDRATHAPPDVAAFACTDCHDPHGSPNIRLVRESIVTPLGPRPVSFHALDGLADGGFASQSSPGTGICETCHTTTQFYRADGSGAPHFALSCLPCHTHTNGFLPQ